MTGGSLTAWPADSEPLCKDAHAGSSYVQYGKVRMVKHHESICTIVTAYNCRQGKQTLSVHQLTSTMTIRDLGAHKKLAAAAHIYAKGLDDSWY
jgi:hypothetical protein